MNRIKFYSLLLLGFLGVSIVCVILWINQATSTQHEFKLSELGHKSNQKMLISSLTLGQKVSLHTISSADWEAPLSGLINLEHPDAKHAELEDRSESIQVYIHHIQHPTYGDFIIDTGVAKQFVEAPQSQGIPSWLATQFGIEKMEIITSTNDFIARLGRPLKGVFLTHLHLDHISGIPAIDKHVPLYIGQGETTERYYLFAATRGAVDTILEGRPALQQWTSKYVDVFGDGSVFAIHSPGHTAGSTAYLVNSTNGPTLLTGDASHTAWGWNNQIEPGKFSTDKAQSRQSLDELIQLVKNNPDIKVKPGHQAL